MQTIKVVKVKTERYLEKDLVFRENNHKLQLSVSNLHFKIKDEIRTFSGKEWDSLTSYRPSLKERLEALLQEEASVRKVLDEMKLALIWINLNTYSLYILTCYLKFFAVTTYKKLPTEVTSEKIFCNKNGRNNFNFLYYYYKIKGYEGKKIDLRELI